MSGATIRISKATCEMLRGLAADTGLPLQAVLDQALDVYQRERFFDALDAAYQAVWSDPIGRQDELDERRLFEATLTDDLDES